MRKFTQFMLACLIGSGSALAVPAMAQEGDQCSVERFAPPPHGCQRERLAASGRQRPFLRYFPSARMSARNSWERQALTKFGERFKNWDNAVCKSAECVKGSLSGMRRCTYVGYACVRNPKLIGESVESPAPVVLPPASKSPHLRHSEIRRMQRWLRREGYRRVNVRGLRRELKVDGQWGEVTRTAIALWLEREDIDDSTMTDRDVFNALRERVRR